MQKLNGWAAVRLLTASTWTFATGVLAVIAVPVVSQQLVFRLLTATDPEPPVSVSVAQYVVAVVPEPSPTCTRRIAGRVVPVLADSVTWMVAVSGSVVVGGAAVPALWGWAMLQPTAMPQFA
jgi:hypothetical protein